MKKLNLSILTLLTLIIFALSSCKTNQTLANGKSIDPRLVGIWAGSEKDQQIEGVSKEWEMTRNQDGTYVLDFKATYPDEVEEITETGTWYTEKNKFYEYHKNSNKTDTYTFEVLNKDEVKFVMIDSEIKFDEPNYTFIDKRKASSNETVKDGSSFESAIKVNSVPEEYAYIRGHCEDCELLGQSLIFENNKPFDKIDVKNKEGKEVSYYFNISSFFGKY